MVHELPNLTFLVRTTQDDRPVFPEDRRFVEAFFTGGIEAEREERKAFTREKEEERLRNHLAFYAMIEDARARHRAQHPHDAGDDSGSQSTTIPSLPASSDEEGKSSHESVHNSSSSEAEERKGDDVIEDLVVQPALQTTTTVETTVETQVADLATDRESDVPPLIEDVFITSKRQEAPVEPTETPIWVLSQSPDQPKEPPRSAPTFLIEEMVASDPPPTFSIPMPSEGREGGTQLDELD